MRGYLLNSNFCLKPILTYPALHQPVSYTLHHDHSSLTRAALPAIPLPPIPLASRPFHHRRRRDSSESFLFLFGLYPCALT